MTAPTQTHPPRLVLNDQSLRSPTSLYSLPVLPPTPRTALSPSRTGEVQDHRQPQKSPLRKLFNRSIHSLSLSPSSSSFFHFATSSSPCSPRQQRQSQTQTQSPSSAPTKTASISYEIHLMDFPTHSELRFEPLSKIAPVSDRLSPTRSQIQAKSARSPSSAMFPFATEQAQGYRIVCDVMNEKEVVLICADDRGSPMARLQTTARGSEIQVKGKLNEADERAVMDQKEGGSQRIYAGDEVYNWTETTGLALLVNLDTRQSLAKIQYKMFAKDQLTLSGEGLECIPLIVLTAAKIWSEHHSERDFRLH
ncbi:hypothetical protein IAT40_001409 [Kwoniella sp. CBS 6097]